MRFEGVVKSWQDERGFGFIEPIKGGQELFVHIKAFPTAFGRPSVGAKVTFEVEPGTDGKKRAVKVQPLAGPKPVPLSATGSGARRGVPSKSWETSSIAVLAIFGITYLVSTLVWKLPLLVGAGYLAMSVICAGFYWFDKDAAQRNEWRISEETLLGLGLFCGWPGAIVAQQLLRHKTTKPSFRTMHWVTVVLNLSIFILAATPLLRILLKA
jgi:uncharacterized membrane protein YsdA (DUF1294 family)/cold shock CspA family protein